MLLPSLAFFAVLESGVAQSASPLKTAGKYVSHSPIFIGNNTDFLPANGVVSGNGTEENPYIIENWEIDARGTDYCIRIENTTAHFVIRNCKLWNATSAAVTEDKFGILLRNVMNGTILNCECSNNNVGIRIEQSFDIVISNSACIRNYFIGMHIVDPRNNLRIEGNNCSHTLCGHGIIVVFTPYIQSCVLINNICWENNESGIDLMDARNCTITYNNCSRNMNDIALSYSDNITIENNQCSESLGANIYLWMCTNIIVKNNRLGKGISIDGSSLKNWNTHIIENNTISGKPIYYYKNQGGGTVPKDAGQVVLANCVLMNISGLNITGAYTAIQLGFSSANNITNNTCSNNSEYGIYLRSCNETNITNNNCSDNLFSGIWMCSSRYNTITNNSCSGNKKYDGICISSDSSYNIITGNNCSGNSKMGIALVQTDHNTIINNTCRSNGECGIYLYACTSAYNEITNNNCTENGGYGIFLNGSTKNILTYNNCSNNFCGMKLYLQSSDNTITDNYFYNNTRYGINISYLSKNNTIHHNYFYQNNGAVKGVNGNCQAYDSVGGNYWYDNTAQEGNYWSNWDGSGWGTPNAYPIDGDAGAYDMYPIGNPAPEFSPFAVIVSAIALLCLAALRNRK